MPTKERLQARADARRWLTLHEAAARVGYSAEYMRKMRKDPPPLEKYRGRWLIRADKLDAWIANRDGAVAS